MNMMKVSQSEQAVSSGFRVDVSRGQRIGRVSSEWFSRPDDERYLNLPDLHEAVRGRAERAQARTVESRAIKVEASRDHAERLALIVPGRDEPVAPTHWSFGQLCTLVGAPTSYLRQLPAALCGINLQHGLLSHRAELVKTLEADTRSSHWPNQSASFPSIFARARSAFESKPWLNTAWQRSGTPTS
jgi:hypothetical protein